MFLERIIIQREVREKKDRSNSKYINKIAKSTVLSKEKLYTGIEFAHRWRSFFIRQIRIHSGIRMNKNCLVFEQGYIAQFLAFFLNIIII